MENRTKHSLNQSAKGTINNSVEEIKNLGRLPGGWRRVRTATGLRRMWPASAVLPASTATRRLQHLCRHPPTRSPLIRTIFFNSGQAHPLPQSLPPPLRPPSATGIRLPAMGPVSGPAVLHARRNRRSGVLYEARDNSAGDSIR